VHELKHDGYRLQIHVHDGRVRLYTITGADWTSRYPGIVKEASRLRAPLIIDAEVVCLDYRGVPNFDALHSRAADDKAVALAFDLLLAGDDIRRQPLIERKKELKWVLRKSRGGVQYVEHTEGDGVEMFKAICKLGLEGIVSKKLNAPYKSGPSKAWLTQNKKPGGKCSPELAPVPSDYRRKKPSRTYPGVGCTDANGVGRRPFIMVNLAWRIPS
jgi:bifunctional non-homologous end joining protein LigD